jgi:hypothetical protein
VNGGTEVDESLAIGPDGHESLVSACVATARRFAPLQFAQ